MEREKISVADIDKHALEIIRKLRHGGYQAYIVGGCVRDLLLGHKPKDFDIATNATPEEIHHLFPRQSRIIGRRFRLVHVFFGKKITEVATFRKQSPIEDAVEDIHPYEHGVHAVHESGLILRDNAYGTLEEDVARRDFSINALYYDPETEKVLDLVDGLNDIKARCLRIIGEPIKRYREDPVRILRAIRFAAKLDFSIERATHTAIIECRDQLALVAKARLFDEVLKLFHSGHGVSVLQRLQDYGVFERLFPIFQEVAELNNDERFFELLTQVLKNTDERIHENKTVNPAFLFSTLLWSSVQYFIRFYTEHDMTLAQAREAAMRHVLHVQRLAVSIPRYLVLAIREIWGLQIRLTQLQPRKIAKTIIHPRFRAAVDFFILRAKVADSDQAIAEWWNTFQKSTADEKNSLIQQLEQKKLKKSKRRKKTKKATENLITESENAQQNSSEIIEANDEA